MRTVACFVSMLVSSVFSSSCAAMPTGAPMPSSLTGKTLRFDFNHVGTDGKEQIAPDAWRIEGEWPGSWKNLIDNFNYGKYRFVVSDAGSGQALYSRGFSSIYGEWETTGEAKQGVWRSFQESVRFPEPKGEFSLALEKRGADGKFAEIYQTKCDPKSRFVSRAPLAPLGQVWPVFENGDPNVKVDLLIMSEGYQPTEFGKFHDDAKRLTKVMFETEPFKRNKKNFNVWAIDLPSPESGITNPRKGVWRNTPLGLSFNAFDTDRYVLTNKNKAIREAAALAPYDAIIIVFNDQKYGGGGIFNLWSTVSADTGPAGYVFVHEFGHSFGDLADEYYTSEVAYIDFTKPGVEPEEPNITALLDPANLKWKDLVEPGTPLPTPWEQDSYDKASVDYQARRKAMVDRGVPETEMDRLFEEVKSTTGPMLASSKFSGKIGAFEGGGYVAKGIFRPASDCIMFTRNPSDFCKVCERAIERMIQFYAE